MRWAATSGLRWRLVRVAVAICLVVLATACADTHPPGSEKTRLVIFHVNDLHGEIGYLPRMAALIEAERRVNPDVLFLSAGDNFIGNPYVDQSDPRGEPMLQLFNQMGLDLMTLGNHDFDYGQEALRRFVSRARFPVLCANVLVLPEGIISQPPPFAQLRTRGGLRIAVLGLIQIDGTRRLPDCHPDHLQGLVFYDDIQTGCHYGFLDGNNDLFIALTHLGLGRDKVLAQAMTELDLIVGGHSHTAMDRPLEVGGTLIVQAGSHGRYLGRIDLEFDEQRLVSRRARLLDLQEAGREDPAVAATVARIMDNPKLKETVTRMEVPLEGKVELGNLATDAIRVGLRLDMAFYNAGGLRVNRLAGEVTLADLYALHPFGNEIVVFEMTPSDIRSLIRYDVEHVAPLDLQVSGLSYTLVTAPDGGLRDVLLLGMNDAPLPEGRVFKVGMNNYMASVYRFDRRGPGRSSHRRMVDLMIDHLRGDVNVLPLKARRSRIRREGV